MSAGWTRPSREHQPDAVPPAVGASGVRSFRIRACPRRGIAPRGFSEQIEAPVIDCGSAADTPSSSWLIRGVALGGGAVLAGALLAGCVSVEPLPCSDGTGAGVVALVSGTGSDPRPSLTPRALAKLEESAGSLAVTDGPLGVGVPAVVISADGETRPPADLAPRRANCQVDGTGQHGALIQQNISEFAVAVSAVSATEPGLDLVQAIADSVAGRDPGVLLIVSHGLSTRGAFDIRQVGWRADPAHIVGQLRSRDLLPVLNGWEVLWTGLGMTAGDRQPPLSFANQATLESYWSAICQGAGAQSCEFDRTRIDPVDAEVVVEMPLVQVEGVSSVFGPQGALEAATFSDDVLGYRGDSALISGPGLELIDQLATRIANPRSGVQPAGGLLVTGYCADAPGSTPAGLDHLSSARAEAVSRALEAALARHGLTLSISSVGGGTAPNPSTAIVDGKFVESVAAQMRRVEITAVTGHTRR